MQLQLKRKLGALLAALLLATPLVLVTSAPASAATDSGQAFELEGDIYLTQSGEGYWDTVRSWVCNPVVQVVTTSVGAAAAILSAAATGAATAGVSFVTVMVCNWETVSVWISTAGNNWIGGNTGGWVPPV